MDVLAHDAEGSGLRLPCFQADDDVVPARIGSLRNVSTARIRLCMGMAVGTPNDLEAVCLSSQFSAQMFLRVDRVDHRTVRNVGARYKTHDFSRVEMSNQ